MKTTGHLIQRRPSMWSWVAVLATTGVLAIALSRVQVVLDGSRVAAPAATVPPSADPAAASSASLSLRPSAPIPDGEPVPVEVVTDVLQECGCPGLPTSEKAGQVERAWVNPQGAVALRFNTGLHATAWPDGRTPAEYIADVEEAIASGDWEGPIIPLRRTLAMATDINRFGPAVVSWIEGHNVSLYGKGGQTLAELIEIAESMP